MPLSQETTCSLAVPSHVPDSKMKETEEREGKKKKKGGKDCREGSSSLVGNDHCMASSASAEPGIYGFKVA